MHKKTVKAVFERARENDLNLHERLQAEPSVVDLTYKYRSRRGLFCAVLNEELVTLLNGPDVTDVFIDGTHCATTDGTQLVCYMVRTEQYRVVPALYVITTGHHVENYTYGARILMERGICPRRVHCDMEVAEHYGCAQIWPNAKVLYCHFHLMDV